MSDAEQANARLQQAIEGAIRQLFEASRCIAGEWGVSAGGSEEEAAIELQEAYAAASADTERLVRAAVEATREEANKQVNYMLGTNGSIPDIDIDVIVARVMQEPMQRK